MKKSFVNIPTLAALLFLIQAASVSAMPPHPGNTNPSGKERPAVIEEGQTPLYQSLMRSSPAMRTSSIATGTVNVLVILIDFPDLPITTPSATVFFKQLLETGGGNTMTQYYNDMSQNNLQLTFNIAGPYTASNNYAYYGQNDSNGYDRYAATLVGEAVDLAESDGLDFSTLTESNGFLPSVIIIHSGQGEEYLGNDDTIWSHNWKLSSAEIYGDGTGTRLYDGVYIDNYTIQPEFNSSAGDATIGVFCHEFGHVLGLPDLYDTSGETNGVGAWSLMASGSWGSGDGIDPAPLLAWEKYFIGGSDWVSITTLTTGAESISINDINESNLAYKVPLGSSGQYIIMEGKKKVINGSDWVVPEDGILITQINENVITKYLSYNSVNSGFEQVHGVNVIEAESDYYDNAGRGSLWRDPSPAYGSMTFSAETRSYLLPSSSRTSSVKMFPLWTIEPGKYLPLLFVSVLLIALYTFKKQKRAIIKSLFYISFITVLLTLTSCPSGSDGESYPLVSHPNTNFYESEDIYSKVGISGVRISNISSNSSFPLTFDLEMP